MKNLFLAALGSTALVALGGSYYLWHRRDVFKDHLTRWKNKRISDAYYDTITEKDIAWG